MAVSILPRPTRPGEGGVSAGRIPGTHAAAAPSWQPRPHGLIALLVVAVQMPRGTRQTAAPGGPAQDAPGPAVPAEK